MPTPTDAPAFVSHDVSELSGVSRRGLFALGAAAFALPALTAGAQEDPAGANGQAKPESGLPEVANAGHYRTELGTFRLVALCDGHFTFDPIHPTLGSNVDADQFDTAVRAAHVDGYSHVNALLVQTPERNVLIDAGSGDTFAPSTGRLITRLADAGLRPDDITDILVTHAHLDHVGGLIEPGTDRCAFPNATVHLAQAELDFWSSEPGLEASGVPEAMKAHVIQVANAAFAAARPQLQLFDPGAEPELLPGITAMPAPGHTPGHTHFQLESEGQRLLFVGDSIFFVPVLTTHPDWYVGFDTDLAEAAASRFATMQRAADERLRIAGSHLPFPAFGHLTSRGAGFDYHAELWRF